jgi:hypothetical protein
VTHRELRRATDAVTRAAAALIPLAAGGRDGDGNRVVDAADAVRRAREAIREALEILDHASH